MELRYHERPVGRRESIRPAIGRRTAMPNEAPIDEARARDVALLLVAEAVPLYFAYCDREERYRFVSDAYAARFGRRAQEIIGKCIWEVVGDSAYQAFRAYVDRALAGEAVEFEMEVPYEAFGGRIVHAAYVPHRSGDGTVEGFAAVISDLTERRRAERAAFESRDILETVNRVGQAVAAELNLESVVQTVLDAATQLTGAEFGAFFYNRIDEQGEAYTLYSLSGAPREAFATFPMPRNTALFGPTFRGEGVVRCDDVTKDPRYGQNAPYYGKPAGHLPVTSYLAIPVISRSGEILGGLFFGHSKPGVFTEQSERLIVGLAAQAAVAVDNARLFEAEQRARADAEAANRAKDEFLSVVSHELRTPLNSILGWTRVLGTDKTGQRTARAIESIARSVRTQTRLIEDLLDVSRIASRQLRLESRPVDLEGIVRSAVEEIRPEAETKGVSLELALGTPTFVVGDADRLLQIASNLLGNAVKFTPAAGRIEVRLEREAGEARLVVSDNGRGIAPDFLPLVFEPFRQAESVANRREGGLGLGLAITRHLVELHGGRIHVESPGEDAGSIFAVSLPLASQSASGARGSANPGKEQPTTREPSAQRSE
jgi:PAS domain S-box-containing protein